MSAVATRIRPTRAKLSENAERFSERWRRSSPLPKSSTRQNQSPGYDASVLEEQSLNFNHRPIMRERSVSTSSDPRATSLVAHEELPAHSMTPEIIKEIAMEIGKDVASHIEIMYPKAIEATSKNMLVSLRNNVSNRILDAVRALDKGNAIAWIETSRANRKKMRAYHRKLSGETLIEGSADYE